MNEEIVNKPINDDIPKRPLSFEEAANVVDKVIKKDKIDVSKAPITVADPVSRKKYLYYCITLCPDKKSKVLLTLRAIYDMSHEQIAIFLQKNGFGTETPEKVKKAEKEAIKRVQEVIRIKQATSIPILGGLN